MSEERAKKSWSVKSLLDPSKSFVFSLLDVRSEFDISKTSKENTKDFDGSKSDFSKSFFLLVDFLKNSVERYYKGILLKTSPDILQNLYYRI